MSAHWSMGWPVNQWEDLDYGCWDQSSTNRDIELTIVQKLLSKEQRERKTGKYMRKERAYSAKPSIKSGDRCQASLSELDLLLANHRPHARSFRLKATQAIGPNPVPTMGQHHWQSGQLFGLWVNPLVNRMTRIAPSRHSASPSEKSTNFCTF
jgi:hypothetical protein